MSAKNTVSTYTNTNIYKKANSLIMSWSAMPVITNKLFMLGIMQAVEQDNGTYVAVIPGKMLKTLFGDSSGSFYTRVRNACINKDDRHDPHTLINYTAFFEDEEQHEFIAQNLITDAAFTDNKLFIRYNPGATKYLFELKNRYTELNADIMISLDNSYTWRLFELFQKHIGLKRYEYKRKSKSDDGEYVVTFGLTRLKLCLGIIDINQKEVIQMVRKNQLSKKINDEDNLTFFDQELEKLCTLQSYIRFNNFKTRVLETARKEMEEKTPLSFTYETKCMTGNRNTVTHIVFHIHDKNAKKDIEQTAEAVDTDEMIDMVRDIISENLPTKDIRAIIKTAGGDITKIEEAYKIACQQPRDNLTGYIIRVIEGGCMSYSKRKTGFVESCPESPVWENFDYSTLIDN